MGSGGRAAPQNLCHRLVGRRNGEPGHRSQLQGGELCFGQWQFYFNENSDLQGGIMANKTVLPHKALRQFTPGR